MLPYSSLVVSAPESGMASRISHRHRTVIAPLRATVGCSGLLSPQNGPDATGFTPGAAALTSTGKDLPATTGSTSYQLVSFNSTLCHSATVERNVLHKAAPPGLYGHSDLVRPQPLSTAHLVRASNTASQEHQRQKARRKLHGRRTTWSCACAR